MFTLASTCASRPSRPGLPVACRAVRASSRSASSAASPHPTALRPGSPDFECTTRSSDTAFDPPTRSALRPKQAATTASAEFSVRLTTVALCALRASFATLRTSLRLSCVLWVGQAQGEIPGKIALLHCTTAGFTPLRLDHESFAVHRPLALLGSVFYPILVHRLAAYAPRLLPTLGRPRAVALHFVRCDQLTAGLSHARVHPC